MESATILCLVGDNSGRNNEADRVLSIEIQLFVFIVVDGRYQKQLQDNYMHLYKRSRDLEQENNVLANKLRHLTMTSASTSNSSSTMGGGEKRLMNGGGDVTSSASTQALSYPMDI